MQYTLLSTIYEIFIKIDHMCHTIKASVIQFPRAESIQDRLSDCGKIKLEIITKQELENPIIQKLKNIFLNSHGQKMKNYNGNKVS